MNTADEKYMVRKIDNDGTEHPYFVLDIDGMVLLLKSATPWKCKFEITKL